MLFIKLVQGCPFIEYINIYLCNNISDISIIEISKECPLLKDISIGYCTDVTSYGLIVLCNGCPLLRWIYSSNCNKISEEFKNGLTLSFPKLKMLHAIF